MDKSFGVIALSEENQVLLIKDTHGNWGFPKGHKEGTETETEAAERELEEETGLQIDHWIDHPPLITSYTLPSGKEKEVIYFLAKVTGNISLHPEEIKACGWFALDQVEPQLTFTNTQSLFRQVIPWIVT